MPKHSGRALRYLELRAIAECDPRSVYGKPWPELKYEQQIELMAYAQLRMEERAGPQEDEDG